MNEPSVDVHAAPSWQQARALRALARLGVLGLSVVLSGCPPAAGPDGGEDAGDVDAGGEDFCREGLPPPSDPCLPTCALNVLGVGQPCTEGGGECTGLPAFFCTVDFAETNLAFCTLACVADDQCGPGAACDIDPEDPGLGAGCVPLTCLDDPADGGPPVDAGPLPVDAGSADAGPLDAGSSLDGG